MSREESRPQDRAWYDLLSRAESAVLSALLILSLVIVLLQVTSRSIFDQPLTWTDEASRLMLIWLTFIGAGCLMARGRHLAVDAMMSLLPVRGRMLLEVVSNVFVIVVCAVVFFAGIGFVATVSRSASTALSISMFWFYGAALIGLALVCLHAIVNSQRAIREGTPIYPSAADEIVEEAVTEDREPTDSEDTKQKAGSRGESQGETQ